MSLKDQMLGLLCILLWCVNFPALSLISDQLSPVQITGLRLGLPAIAAILLFRFPRHHFHRIFFLGLGYFSVPLVLTTYALKDIHPTIVAIITNFEIIFVLLAERFIFATKIKPSEIFGIALSFLGANLILFSPEINITNISGALLALAAAIAYAVTAFQIKKIPVSAIEMTLWSACMGSVQCLVYSLIVESPSVDNLAKLSPDFWLVIAFSSVSSILAFWIWNDLLIRNPVYQVSSFVLLIPLMTFIVSAIMIQKPLETKALIGGVLCLTGPSIPYVIRKFRTTSSEKTHHLGREKQNSG